MVIPAAWLVDLDGTLYRPLWVKLAMGLEIIWSSRTTWDVVHRFRVEHELLRSELASEVPSPYRVQLERTAKRTGVGLRQAEEIVQEWMIDRPGKWIRAFKASRLLAEINQFKIQGGRTALVSDYPALRKLDALNARSLFDVVVANGEPGGPGRLKPWPDGYLKAAHALGLPPSRCLVLGDRPELDGEAARRAGMSFRQVR